VGVVVVWWGRLELMLAVHLQETNSTNISFCHIDITGVWIRRRIELYQQPFTKKQQ
jgi:hypothetical protein